MAYINIRVAKVTRFLDFMELRELVKFDYDVVAIKWPLNSDYDALVTFGFEPGPNLPELNKKVGEKWVARFLPADPSPWWSKQ